MVAVACERTRLDIANAVRAVTRYAKKPREVLWSTSIGILEYVFGTSDFGVTFQRGRGLELVAFDESNCASKVTDKRSVSGGALMCVWVRACSVFLGVRSTLSFRALKLSMWY